MPRGNKIEGERKSMNKKTLAIGGIIAILLLGIMSASLIDYFGRITGSVEVEAPVFYLDGHISGVFHNLYVNELPEKEEISFQDGQRVVFKTPALDVEGFYKANFNLIFYAKTTTSGNQIQMRIGRIDENNIFKTICEADEPITIGATERFRKYESSCAFNDIIPLEKNEGFALELTGTAESDGEIYYISVGDDSREHGASRIEVTAITTEIPKDVELLEITINSPIENNTYDKESVPINLTTNIPAKCKYQFWFPYNFDSGNETEGDGFNDGITPWFGTSYYTITDDLSTQHISTIGPIVYDYIAFKCTDEKNNTKHTDKIHVNTTLT